jgi:DNA gyrase/topoisomerase IV subunit B
MKNNTIKVLSETEHVLKRSGMYVGSTVRESVNRWIMKDDQIVKDTVAIVPGFLKLFDEIVSNSIDEYFRTDGKYANIIRVGIDNNVISVYDNGRGLPQVKSKDVSGKTMAEVAVTSLRAGTNFEEENVSIGTNGLGASLVNLFSVSFKVDTHNKKNNLIIHSKNNMESTESKIIKKKAAKSYTTVVYTPDYSRFGMLGMDDVHYDMIVKRIHDLAICFPEIKFYMDGNKIKTNKFDNYCSIVSNSHVIIEAENYKIGVLSNETRDQMSFVNGIETFRGGGHVDHVSTVLSALLTEKLNKKYKLKLKINDIKNKLLFVVILNNVKGLTFDSQTKERVTNSSRFFQGYFDTKDLPLLVDKILKNDDIVMPIIEAVLLKQQMKDAAELRKQQKKNRKKRVIKHVEAKGPNNTLFLCEGDSAISNLLKVRNSKTQGGFPLKGKVLNTIDMKPTDIVKNEEISSILSILGLEFGCTAKMKSYDYVGILTDADVDGAHIATLLIGLFSHWPELFKENRIHFYKSPLMIAEKGKKKKLLYSMQDIAAFNPKGWTTKYLKGLGALNEDIYEEVINQKPDVLTWDESTSNSINIALGSEFVENRKEWLSS